MTKNGQTIKYLGENLFLFKKKKKFSRYMFQSNAVNADMFFNSFRHIYWILYTVVVFLFFFLLLKEKRKDPFTCFKITNFCCFGFCVCVYWVLSPVTSEPHLSKREDKIKRNIFFKNNLMYILDSFSSDLDYQLIYANLYSFFLAFNCYPFFLFQIL